MSREEHAVFTVLCMVTDDQGRFLMEDRNDPSWPGLCFPGGHVEPGESFTEAAIREVWEETGLTIANPILCGVKQFQTQTNARYVVFFYRSNSFSGTIHSSDEGEVFWVAKEDLCKYTLAEDLMDMLKVMESGNLSEFYYYKEQENWGFKLL